MLFIIKNLLLGPASINVWFSYSTWFHQSSKQKFSYMEKSCTIEKKLRNKIKECIIVVSYICFFDKIHPFCLLSLMIFFCANCFVLLVKNVFLTQTFKQNFLLFHSILQFFRLNINYDSYSYMSIKRMFR